MKYVADGRLERRLPSLDEIQKYHQDQMRTLPEEFKRLDVTAEKFPVAFSEKLETVAKEFMVAE
jgi:hypothetical protein